MKKLILILFVAVCQFALAQEKHTISAEEMRSILLQGLKTTHDDAKWFVPVNTAVEGVTAEQASWKDGTGNHSIGQLAYHIWFWNKSNLDNFQGKTSKQPGSNEETFDKFDQKQWAQLVKDLDQVMKDLESLILNAPEAKLREWAPTIMNISTHNAYHTGQIIFVRKLQKSWDPKKGVQ